MHLSRPRRDRTVPAAQGENALCVAVIPARGGSKRLPEKNTRSFLGKPAISYAIAVARRSGLFDRIVVSTDCPKIANVAASFGAEVPFLRPAELADDHCGTFPVFQYALDTLESFIGRRIVYACCLYPTAVLLTEGHLIEAFHRLAQSTHHSYCFSVCQYHHPIQRALRIDELGQLTPVTPDHSKSRTQDLEAHYFDAGQFYWAKRAAVKAGIPMFSSASLPYVLRWSEFVDVDSADDRARAEAIATALRANQRHFPDTQDNLLPAHSSSEAGAG